MKEWNWATHQQVRGQDHAGFPSYGSLLSDGAWLCTRTFTWLPDFPFFFAHTRRESVACVFVCVVLKQANKQNSQNRLLSEIPCLIADYLTGIVFPFLPCRRAGRRRRQVPGTGGAEPGACPGWIRLLQVVQCAHGIWIYIDDPQRWASSGASIRRLCPPGESTWAAHLYSWSLSLALVRLLCWPLLACRMRFSVF